MSSADDPSSKKVELDSLSLEQLNQVKQQEEQRWQALGSRYQHLRAASARLQSSKLAVQELAEAPRQAEVMVPLTESLYVPAKMKEAPLLVEIGTGFYVEKSTQQTCAFLDRKLKIVDANSENIAQAMQATKQNMESVVVAMQSKMLEIRARQEGRKLQSMSE